MGLTLGTMLGHYRIVEQIGRGGMGEVYTAEDTRLGRHVALKLLPPDVAANPRRLRRFELEAKALAKLQHPNIVTIYSVEQVGGSRFLTMELVQGATLSDRLPDDGLSLADFFRLAIPLARSLHAAHRNGIIHRDLKPSNIMLSEESGIKVLDFGLASIGRARAEAAPGPDEAEETEELTLDGHIMGTPPYMSPEQVAGEDLDHRSDIYALGTVMYEMLTGRHPFAGQTGTALLLSIHDREPPAISERHPQVPKELAAIVHTCLEKKPGRRYQSADELRRDLERLAGSLSILSTFPTISRSLPGLIRRRAARRARLWATVVSGLVVCGLVLAFYLLRAGAAENGRTVPGSQHHRKRIVVIPFENLGPAEDDYFAHGISDEISSRLTTVRDLGVISRTSAAKYVGSDKTPRQIGKELGVDFILEGTVRWDRGDTHPDRVRVLPRLLSVDDNIHVWSSQYEEVMNDIFVVQSEIAEHVIDQLGIALHDQELAALQVRPTRSIDAYRAYLRGSSAAPYYVREETEEAVRLLEQAVALDPEFAQAHAQLSIAYSRLYTLSHGANRSELLQRAQHAAERALTLDPDLADGHLARGFHYYWCHLDYEEALQELTLAAVLLPNDSRILGDTALIYRRQGRWQLAVDHHQRQLQIDPQNAVGAGNLGVTYTFLRDYEQAEQALDLCISIDSERPVFRYYQAWLYWLWDGTPERARQVLDTMPTEDHELSCTFWYYQELFERHYEAALDRISSAPDDTIFDVVQFTTKPSMQCFAKLKLAEQRGAQGAVPAECDQARLFLEQRIDGDPDSHGIHAALALVNAYLGDADTATAEAAEAVRSYPLAKDAFWGPELVINQAMVQALLGQQEEAISTIEYLLGIPCLLSPGLLRLDPAWDSLRGHPRFQQLLAEAATAAAP